MSFMDLSLATGIARIAGIASSGIFAGTWGLDHPRDLLDG
jgi:hypothetical protein